MKKILLVCLALVFVALVYWGYKNPVAFRRTQKTITSSIRPNPNNTSSVQRIDRTELTDLYQIEVMYPQTGFDAIDNLLVDGFDQQINDLKELANDTEEFIADFGIPYSLQSDYEVTRDDDQILSFQLPIYEYTGGAHGNTGTLTFVYDKQKDQLVNLEDLFDANTDYLFAISDEATRQLSEREGLENDEWVKEGAGVNRANFESFVLTEKEIIFIFDAYQVGPYSAGIHEVIIPLNTLSDLLASDYQQL